MFQHDKITVQSYTHNNTVNIVSHAGYMMDLWNVCTINVMPMYHHLTSQMVNKSTCHFTVNDYTNLQHSVGYTVPKMSVYAILYCTNWKISFGSTKL